MDIKGFGGLAYSHDTPLSIMGQPNDFLSNFRNSFFYNCLEVSGDLTSSKECIRAMLKALYSGRSKSQPERRSSLWNIYEHDKDHTNDTQPA